jgi:transposase InsO family protein
VSRYRHVDAMKAEGFAVAAACRAAEVSTSGYYDWKTRRQASPSDVELEEAYLVNEIFSVHAGSDKTYGSPRVTMELRRRGYCVNHRRVERLMAEAGIVGLTPRRFVRTTLPSPFAAELPDLVQGDFSPGAPNSRYCGDITYVRTGEGWLYMASVLDLGSRRLAGWAMAEHMRTELVAEALQATAALRGCLAGAVFHSDYAEVWVKPRIQGFAWSSGPGRLSPRLNDLVLSEAV